MQKRFDKGRRALLLAGSAVVGLSGLVHAQSSTETYTYDALGRLVVASTVGGDNDGQTHSLCYDSADNRNTYKAAEDGSAAACVNTGSPTGTPTPSPTPTPPPGNSAPVTVNDLATAYCNTSTTVNLTANDSDPDGNTPLQLTAITKTSGTGVSASIVSASSVSISPLTSGTKTFTYTVQDTLGATAQGTLTVTVPAAECEL